MAARGASAGRLLERQILLAAVEKERVDRRAVIRPAERHAADDLQRRGQSDWVGRRPAGRSHRADHVLLRPFESDVDDVARNALGGDRSRAEICEAGLMLVMAPGERRQEVGEDGIGREDRDGGRSQTPIELFCRHRRAFGDWPSKMQCQLAGRSVAALSAAEAARPRLESANDALPPCLPAVIGCARRIS